MAIYNIYEVYAEDNNKRRYEDLVGQELSPGETYQFLLDLIESDEEREEVETSLYENEDLEELYLNKDLYFSDTTIIVRRVEDDG